MLIQKADDLGIYVGDDAVATAANEILSIRRNWFASLGGQRPTRAAGQFCESRFCNRKV